MKHFQAVIFDMDGLLLDTERLALSAFLNACDQLGLPALHEVFVRCIGTNEDHGRKVLREGLGGYTDVELFEQAWERQWMALMERERIAVKEGVEELLAHISLLQKPTAVATSSHTERSREKLQAAGILDSFHVLVGGDQVARSKPAPDIYLRAAELLRVPPSACLALEDSENGVRAALSAGMTVVQVPDLVEPSEALCEMGHVVLRSLKDVVTYPFDQISSSRTYSLGVTPKC